MSLESFVTKKNLLYSTFIDLPIEIVNSSQRKLVGVKGVVVDETKNTITIEIEEKEKKEMKIPKKGCVFRFTVSDGAVVVEGKAILFRPHERPKKV